MSDSPSNRELQKELIKDFIIESSEGLDFFDNELLTFETEGDLEQMNNVFRIIHTIKGTAGCLGLNNIEKIAHSGENLLSQLRDGKIQVNQEMVTSLLNLSDVLKESIQTLERTGSDSGNKHCSILEKMEGLLARNPEDSEQAKMEDPGWGLFDEESEEEKHASAKGEDQEDDGDSAAIENSTTEEENLASLLAAGKTNLAESTIRVDVSQLDKVMNMVGELVLARNQIVVNTTNRDEAALLTASQRLNIITTELQESVMKTRMQPIGNVFRKFPKIVRDVANELGKEVQLTMDGHETELDRTIIEAIKDPLTHIVRNAIDHGIETPDDRVVASKAKEGKLSLGAYHEGGQIVIEITDDGKGIDIEKVRETASQKGIINSSQAGSMSEKEVINLVFQPGFSTAGKVSNVSGRGVGMDVVKTNIEKTGGSIDVSTNSGLGTTIKIKIPLTLAIIPALIVTSADERFAIPQISLLELVRLEGEQAKEGIEMLYGSPVHRLRGKLLPLVYLNHELQISSPKKELESDEDTVVNIVVLQADGRQFGLVVDAINDTEEIVVKPLGKQLKGISSFAGATIMGDGKVALILDVLGIALRASVVTESRTLTSASEAEKTETESDTMQTLLLFTVGEDRRMAIPLSEAARLEKFSSEQIEYTGEQKVVQYRDDIMPLFDVEELVLDRKQISDSKQNDTLEVVVYSQAGRNYGLIVGSIKDIVYESASISYQSDRMGVLGSIVVQGKVTDLLSVSQIVEQHSIPESNALAS